MARARLKPATLVRTLRSFRAFDEDWKQQFGSQGRKLLLDLADLLGLSAWDYDVRVNKAGPALSGEVTLHSDSLYLQLSADQGQDRIMWRWCRHRWDYTGGHNMWAAYKQLLDLSKFAGDVTTYTNRLVGQQFVESMKTYCQNVRPVTLTFPGVPPIGGAYFEQMVGRDGKQVMERGFKIRRMPACCMKRWGKTNLASTELHKVCFQLTASDPTRQFSTEHEWFVSAFYVSNSRTTHSRQDLGPFCVVGEWAVQDKSKLEPEYRRIPVVATFLP